MKKKNIPINYGHNISTALSTMMEFSVKILSYTSALFLLLLPLLFLYLNSVQFHFFIDEKFHIPQTIKYCEGKFFEWDPKITTLPGLYLLSALLLGPLKLCSITYLRLVNVGLTYMNLILTLKLLTTLSNKNRTKKNSKSERKLKSYHLYLTAWNITFFPPLFFYFFLYYTDTLSNTLILSMFLLHLKNNNTAAALMGTLSICVRQTNVIWVFFLGIEKGLTVIDNITRKPHLTDKLNLLPCIKSLYCIFKAKAGQGFLTFMKYVMLVTAPILPYLVVLVSFVTFVIYNGGIVVGDRTAHIPTIHFAQILYYATFILAFSWPYLLPYFVKYLQFIRKNVTASISAVALITLVVHYNTLVHPYILADNRHYSFYIWKNFMNRYVFFRYLLIPVYAFAIYAALKSLSHLRLLSVVAYVLCVFIVMVPQLLLEPRYFIIPYILFRIYQKEPKNWQLVAETLTTSFVSIAQFLLFVNKTFYWEDEKYPQRIGW
ncbi:hypothetical protein TSAR_005041 [Trichomalopsis sarcophagae]|uniref:Dol-P-Glc:Glc(2)Man(9)GlcNAc(2)-PP-Dol alpha-1,2-glucosyltransferase n=1 Tax=Trichomalopsis sarcophagae TaxID=543379 RepID=A0A232F8J6_9HYME|nr:hypothetical protein TSAR_005041 [Trichomalopsis sarcophagae]